MYTICRKFTTKRTKLVNNHLAYQPLIGLYIQEHTKIFISYSGKLKNNVIYKTLK